MIETPEEFAKRIAVVALDCTCEQCVGGVRMWDRCVYVLKMIESRDAAVRADEREKFGHRRSDAEIAEDNARFEREEAACQRQRRIDETARARYDSLWNANPTSSGASLAREAYADAEWLELERERRAKGAP